MAYKYVEENYQTKQNHEGFITTVRVVDVLDGDTIAFRLPDTVDNTHPVKQAINSGEWATNDNGDPFLRLAMVDSPEIEKIKDTDGNLVRYGEGEKGSLKARQFMLDVLYADGLYSAEEVVAGTVGREVTLDIRENPDGKFYKGAHDRFCGIIYVDNYNINRSLLINGLADTYYLEDSNLPNDEISKYVLDRQDFTPDPKRVMNGKIYAVTINRVDIKLENGSVIALISDDYSDNFFSDKNDKVLYEHPVSDKYSKESYINAVAPNDEVIVTTVNSSVTVEPVSQPVGTNKTPDFDKYINNTTPRDHTGKPEYEDGSFILGHSKLYIPPTSITVLNKSTIRPVPTIRSRSSVKTMSGHGDVRVDIEIYFNDKKAINDPNNGLRALIAQFKRTPFLPVENEYLNNVHNIEALTLGNFYISNIPGFPNAYKATLTMYKFNYQSYMPHVIKFKDVLNYPLMKWYWQKDLIYEYNNGIPTDKEGRLKKVTGEGGFTFKHIPINVLADIDEFINDDSNKAIMKTMSDTVADGYDAYHDMSVMADIEQLCIDLMMSGDLYATYKQAGSSQVSGEDLQSKFEAVNKKVEDYLGHDKIEVDSRRRVVYKGANQEYELNYWKIKFAPKSKAVFEAVKKYDWRPISDTVDNINEVMYDEDEITIYIPKNAKELPASLVLVKDIIDRKIRAVFGKDNVETIEKTREKMGFAADFENNASEMMEEWPFSNSNDLILENMEISMENTLTSQTYQMSDTPSHQYLGAQDIYIQIKLTALSDVAVRELREMQEYTRMVSRQFRSVVVPGFLQFDSPLTNIFGIEHVLIDSIQVNTKEGFPGVYDVTMTMVDFDVAQRKRERNGGIVGRLDEGGRFIENFEFPLSNEKYKFVYEGLTDELEKTYQQTNSYVVHVENFMKYFELYPDLELPTYEELYNAADEEIFGKVHGDEWKLQNLNNSIYLDPDFYVAKELTFKDVIDDTLLNGATMTFKDALDGEAKITTKKHEVTNQYAWDTTNPIYTIEEARRDVENMRVSDDVVPTQAATNTIQDIETPEHKRVDKGVDERGSDVSNWSTSKEQEKVASALLDELRFYNSEISAGFETRVLGSLPGITFGDEKDVNLMRNNGIPIDVVFALADSESSFRQYRKAGKRVEVVHNNMGNGNYAYGAMQLSLDTESTVAYNEGSSRWVEAINPNKYNREELIRSREANVEVGLRLLLWYYLVLGPKHDYNDIIRNNASQGFYSDIDDDWVLIPEDERLTPEDRRWIWAVMCYKGYQAELTGARKFDKESDRYTGYKKILGIYIDKLVKWKKLMYNGDVRNLTMVPEENDSYGSPIYAASTGIDTALAMQQKEIESDQSYLVDQLASTGAKEYEVATDLPMPKSFEEQYQEMFHDMKYYSVEGRLLQAFPTYQFIIIDEGKWIRWYRLWDNFYGYNAITDINVVKSRKIAADTLNIQMSNVYNGIVNNKREFYDDKNQHESGVYDFWANVGQGLWAQPTEESLRSRSVLESSLPLKPGARCQLRLGYGADASNLPITFNGTITEMNVGEMVTILAQGDGLELTNQIPAKEGEVSERFGFGKEPRNLIGDLMANRSLWRRILKNASGGRIAMKNDELGIMHFGRPNINDLGEVGQNIYASTEIPQYVDKTVFNPYTWFNDQDDDEKNISIELYDKTVWDVIKIITSTCPNFVSTVIPFGFRSSLFFGRPEWHCTYDYGMNEDGEVVDKRKPLQQVHVVTSANGLISNNIKATSKNMYTHVTATYYTQPAAFLGTALNMHRDEEQFQSVDVWLDKDIYPSQQKSITIDTQIKTKGNILSRDIPIISWLAAKGINKFSTRPLAICAAQGILKDYVKDMYGGALTLQGKGALKPYDMIYLHDYYTDMYGMTEVEQVVHTFNSKTGFMTQVTPDATVSVKDNDRFKLWGAVGAIAAASAAKFAMTALNIAGGAVATYLNTKLAVGAGISAAGAGGLTGASMIASSLLPYATAISGFVPAGIILTGAVLVGAALVDNWLTELANTDNACTVAPLMHKGEKYVAGMNGSEGVILGTTDDVFEWDILNETADKIANIFNQDSESYKGFKAKMDDRSILKRNLEAAKVARNKIKNQLNEYYGITEYQSYDKTDPYSAEEGIPEELQSVNAKIRVDNVNILTHDERNIVDVEFKVLLEDLLRSLIGEKVGNEYEIGQVIINRIYNGRTDIMSESGKEAHATGQAIDIVGFRLKGRPEFIDLNPNNTLFEESRKDFCDHVLKLAGRQLEVGGSEIDRQMFSDHHHTIHIQLREEG